MRLFCKIILSLVAGAITLVIAFILLMYVSATTINDKEYGPLREDQERIAAYIISTYEDIEQIEFNKIKKQFTLHNNTFDIYIILNKKHKIQFILDDLNGDFQLIDSKIKEKEISDEILKLSYDDYICNVEKNDKIEKIRQEKSYEIERSEEVYLKNTFYEDCIRKRNSLIHEIIDNSQVKIKYWRESEW